MKVVLLTTLLGLVENARIQTEVENLGHTFRLVNLSDFSFTAGVDGLTIAELGSEKIDLAIVRGVFQAIKPISVIIEKIRNNGVKVFDNDLGKHLYSIDKVTDIAKLACAGIDVPETFYSRDFADYPEAAERIGYPTIIKLTRSGKGANIYKVDDHEALVKKIAELDAQGREAKSFIIQKFIDYEHDLRVLVIGESVFAMKRIPKMGDFRANFSLGGTVEPFLLTDADKKLSITALNAIGMSVGGVDILIDKMNNRYILEVNHTAGFVGMEKATNKNIGKIFVEHAFKNAK